MEGINMEKSSQGCYKAMQIGFCDSYHNNIMDIQNRLPYILHFIVYTVFYTVNRSGIDLNKDDV